MDVDTKDRLTTLSIEAVIDIAWLKAHPEDADKVREEMWLIDRIPTLNGTHLITRPFNLQILHQNYPDVGVQKNHLTALYVPQCICEKI